VLKWLAIDQDNLRIKFLALNVNFTNSSSVPLGSSRTFAHVAVKVGYPSKKWLFVCYWLV